MTEPVAGTSPRGAALIAGIGYVLIFGLAIFANFFVREGLVEAGDAAATFANISGSESLFRLGLVGFLAVFIADVVVAWALHVLFRTVNRDVSLLAAWFRVVYTVFLGVALIAFFVVLQLVDGAAYLGAFDPGETEALAMLLLEAFNYAWLIGLVAFGVHLMLLGYLILRSAVASRALGILLAIAGAAYVVDTTARALMSGYAGYETAFLIAVAVPSIIGEFGFAVWLLFRAARQPSVVGGAEPRSLTVA